MKKLFTKIVGVSLGIAMAIGVGVGVATSNRNFTRVDATQKTAIVCDFTTKNSSHSSYKDSWDWKNSASDPAWKIHYGANNSAGWAYVKLGSKSADACLSGCYIGSPIIDKEVTKVSVNVLSNTGNNTNKMGVSSWSLGVYSDATYETSIATVDKTSTSISITSGDVYDIVPASGNSWAANSYYKLTFNLTNTSTTNGVLWIQDITFYYEEQSSDPYIGFSESEDVVGVGGTITNVPSYENLGTSQIVYSSSDDDVATVNPTSGTVTGVSFGSATITASATVNDVVYSDDYKVYVTSSSTEYYSVAEARTAINAGKGLTGQYVKGVVYKVDSYNSTYHSITYWISDNGSTSTPLEVYGGLNIEGQEFSAKEDISLGDIVVVKGDLTKYSSTYEFAQNNRLISKTSVSSLSVKTAPSKTAYNESECFDPTGLVVTASYDDGVTSKDYAYADLASSFTFNPSLETALTNENSISIFLFGKSTSQAISITTRAITGVTLMGDMTNKAYYAGDNWDLSGLYISIAWSTGTPNPTTINLIDLDSSCYDLDEANPIVGLDELYIFGSYQGHDFEKTITGITVEKRPPVMDLLRTDSTSLNYSKNSYGSVSNITKTGHSDIKSNSTYAGYIMSATSPRAGAIQLNPSKSTYICTTSSNQLLKTISVVFNDANGNGVKLYGSNTAYTAEYNANGSDSSTLLGTLTSDGSVNVTDEYKYLYIVPSGTTYVDSFTVIWKSAQELIENNETTLSALKIDYSGSGDNYTYSNTAIRFGGCISQSMWNQLEDESDIQGYGVLVAANSDLGGQTIKQRYTAARASAASVEATINSICSTYSIGKKIVTSKPNPAEATAEQKEFLGVSGDYYIWTVQKPFGGAFTSTFNAVAFILIDGDIVFLQEESISPKQIAMRDVPSDTTLPEYEPLHYMANMAQ